MTRPTRSRRLQRLGSEPNPPREGSGLDPTHALRTAGAAAVVAFITVGCAPSVYTLTAMPRDSGTVYSGVVTDPQTGEGTMSVTLAGKTYAGSWTRTRMHGTAYSLFGTGAAWGGRWGPGAGAGGFATAQPLDPSENWLALLRAPDGSGLRCELASGGGGRGGGRCTDDAGRIYDVQFRPREG